MKKKGEIRTHNYHNHARVFSLVSSVLTTGDLFENIEVTNDTYKRLQLLGNDFSKMENILVKIISKNFCKEFVLSVQVNAGFTCRLPIFLQNVALITKRTLK